VRPILHSCFSIANIGGGLLRAEGIRNLLSHTSGITGAEKEEMTAYYAAIGDPKATVLRRYFWSENETEKEEALIEIQQLMQTLVRTLKITPLSTPPPSIKIPTNKHNQPVEPLIFEPGTDWAYGLSTDWAGQIVLTSPSNPSPTQIRKQKLTD
jgi:hypothetical protein